MIVVTTDGKEHLFDNADVKMVWAGVRMYEIECRRVRYLFPYQQITVVVDDRRKEGN